MNTLFEIFSWLATIILSLASVPQVILIFKKKSAQGVSWATYGLLLFGLTIILFRSLITTKDPVIQLNYGAGLVITLIVNLQIFYYRFIKPARGQESLSGIKNDFR